MSATGQEPTQQENAGIREQLAASRQAQAATTEGQEPTQQPNGTEDGQEPTKGGETDPTLAKVRREAKNLRERAIAAEAELNELKQKDMSELERLRTQNQTLEQALNAEKAKSLQQEIGLAKGLSIEAIDILRRSTASTQEELEELADKLKVMSGGKGPAPAPDFGAGARPNGGTATDSENFSATLRRAAGRPA